MRCKDRESESVGTAVPRPPSARHSTSIVTPKMRLAPSVVEDILRFARPWEAMLHVVRNLLVRYSVMSVGLRPKK